LPPATSRRPLYWQPAGIGFVRLTVIDSDGRSARATMRLAQ
jgi:membrane carboxypeptidase/penicillin-binding protein PbpC